MSPAPAKTAIKLCGITNVEDARICVDAGADYLGLIFVDSSPRKVDLRMAHDIIAAVQGQAKIVGVFQNARRAAIEAHILRLALDLVQLHGEEPVDLSTSMPVPVIKMFPIPIKESHPLFMHYLPLLGKEIEYALLEPAKDAVPICWQTTTLNVGAFPCPVFLAGGLTPETVASAIQKFHPFAVDVASGIESKPGKKDIKKVVDFCKAVRHPNQEVLNPCKL